MKTNRGGIGGDGVGDRLHLPRADDLYVGFFGASQLLRTPRHLQLGGRGARDRGFRDLGFKV